MKAELGEYEQAWWDGYRDGRDGKSEIPPSDEHDPYYRDGYREGQLLRMESGEKPKPRASGHKAGHRGRLAG